MDENQENNNIPQSQESENSNRLDSNELREQIRKRISKSSKANVAKKSLVKALMPIITYALVFIIILIIIIGIVLFFITMPGMVMDKIKELARKVGDAVTSWFGGDDTKNVDIYETLNYLEEMGYDLKSNGFLTDYKSESDVGENEYYDYDLGVIRKEDDDKIVKAESDFVTSYLISDNYVYTIKNFNVVNEDGRWHIGEGLAKKIASLFTLGSSNQYWSRGMLEFRHDGGTLGHEGKYYSSYEMGSISVDVEAKTLEIKRGWFNNSMKYNLDGWTGRYGMPVDFLLSVHLATKMPDLAYDMSTSFTTIVEILLHGIGGIFDEGDGTAVGYYKVGSNYVSYDDFLQIAESTIFDGWRISKKEAMDLFRKYNSGGEEKLKSPSDCTGITTTYKNVGGNETPVKLDISSSGSAHISDFTSYFNEMLVTLKKYNFPGNLPAELNEDSNLNHTDEIEECIQKFFNDTQESDNLNENVDYRAKVTKNVETKEDESDPLYNITTSTMQFEYNWIGKNENGESCPFTCIGTLQMEIPELKDEYKNGAINTRERSYSINWNMKQHWSDEEYENYKKENENSDLDAGRCSNSYNDKTETCENCRAYLQKIYDYVKKVDVSDLDIFVPYLAYVKNHWYRDVYFVADPDKEFVDYDYDYEAITKERWTRYETNSNGNYVYYKVNEDGTLGEKYTGQVTSGETKSTDYNGEEINIRSSSVGEDGTKVSKKAVTKKISDMSEDLNWNKVNDTYAAYKVDETTQSNFQNAYADVSDDDDDADIKRNLYVDIQTSGNITQTGEGQRTQTNSKIKNMFLNKTYFRYGDSPEIAEIITKLRKDNNIGYGALTKKDLEKTTKIDGTTYTVKDYAGQVSLEQDALNEFSMLENVHTLDSDYIYRDFKELMVELGYYEKEELTDETPRIIQWLVPDIGSYLYPNRAIDKNEHEYGTMVHSKGDIDVNNKNTLQSVISEAIKESTTNESTDEENDTSETSDVQNNTNGIKPTDESSTLNEIVGNIRAELGEENSNKFVSLGAIPNNENSSSSSSTRSSSSSSSSSNLLSLEEWWTEAQKMFDTYKSEGWVYSDHGNGKSQGCNGGTTFETHGHKDVDCSIGASWMLQKLGALKESHTFTSALGDSGKLSESEQCAQDLLDAGAEVISPPVGTKFTTAANSGELKPGDVLFYDGHVSIYCGDSYEKGGATYCWDTGSTTGIQCGGPRDTSYENRDIKLIIRLPLGNSSGNGQQYEGYEGNEEVVSPVTGILLEYGTYTDEIDSISGEEYRVNVDLKYGTNGNISNAKDENNENEETKTEENSGKIVLDKVGYAKILVLDKEYFEKLEANLKSNTRFKNKQLLSKTGNYKDYTLTEDEVKEWSDIDKTLYGYKEFAELYEEYGIAGNVIYIDGFKCEQKDDEFGSNEDSNSDTEESDGNNNENKEKPKGEEIKFSDFGNITKESFDEDGNLKSTNELHPSLYEADEKVKMASKSATEKINTENSIKKDAIQTIAVGEIKFIKEGTVLGRTITDRELVEDYGDGARGDYSTYRKDGNQEKNTKDKDKDEEKIVGNYLRIIMRDLDETVVENIEDYMKLDDGSEPKKQYENFSVVGTVLSMEEWVKCALEYTTKINTNCSSKFKNEDNLREWYEMNVEKGVNPEYTFARGIQESGLSDSNADSAGTNYWGYDTPNGSSSVKSFSSWQECLGKYCDTIVEYQQPETWQYQEIMKRCHERESCTENGGIDPLGYGDPKTVGGQQCLYSWLGDNHLANNAGDGGMYYLYPWGWGGNQYEGENKIIFESKEEFERLCGSKHGTSGGQVSSTATTVWEQGMYTAWQSRKVVSIAKDIFGELAGTYDG